MAGIGQSSIQQTDQTPAWSSPYSMGRSVMNVENHNTLQNKLLPMSDKRRLLPDENGIVSQNMLLGGTGNAGVSSSSGTGSRPPQTGFQTGLLPPNDGGNLGKPSGGYMGSPINQGNYIDLKQGFNSGGRNQHQQSPMGGGMGYMGPPPSQSHADSQMMMPNRTSMNMYNGAGVPSGGMKRNIYIEPQHSGHWDTSIGNFESNDFPILHKVKSGPSLSHMTTMVPRQPIQPQHHQQQQVVNYQNVLKQPGSSCMAGMHSVSGIDSHQNQGGSQQEFSIQQEDFPALPVAQNPSTSTTSSTTTANNAQSLQTAISSFDQHQHRSASTSVITQDAGSRSFAHTLSSRSGVLQDCDLMQQQQKHIYPSHFESEYMLYQSHQQPQHHMSMMPSVPAVGMSQITAQSMSSVTNQKNALASSNNSSQPPLLSKHPPQPHHQQHSQSNHHKPHSHQKKVLQFNDTNYIANIPKDMVCDAFGLIGLIKLINVNSSYDNLKVLAPGFDMLNELNRDLNSLKDIFPMYVAPLTSMPSGRPHDMDYPVPKEYRIRHLIMDKLAEPLPERLSEETLFWIFYNMTGEECQMVAARQLMARQWRYHRVERFWLIRENTNEMTNTSSSERGTFTIWDYEKLTRVTRSFTLHFKDIENLTGYQIKHSFPFYKRPNAGMMMTSNYSMIQQQHPLAVAAANIRHPNSAVSNSMIPQNKPHGGIPPLLAGVPQQQNPSNLSSLPISSSQPPPPSLLTSQQQGSLPSDHMLLGQRNMSTAQQQQQKNMSSTSLTNIPISTTQ